MEIAGLVVFVQPLFQSTIEYCRPYLTWKEPDYYVSIRCDDLVFEQLLLEREAVEEGLKIRKFKDPFLERSVIQRRVADYLVNRNTLMLHGSAVSVDGQAYLFAAPCGTGKSTHTRLWRELFRDRAVMVNDDKPFLEVTPEGVLAYGSPWSGKHGLASNICVPLKGICFLHRGKENVISPANVGDFVGLIRGMVHIPADAMLAHKAFSLLDLLLTRVSLWEMYCNKEPDAALVSYLALNRGESVLQWVDYEDQHAQIVDSWLDRDTVSMTGLDIGWSAYWQAVQNDALNFPGCKDYCKLVYVGVAPCAVISFGVYQKVLTISEIIVDPRFRGKGIGTRMLLQLVEMARNLVFGSVNVLSAVVYPQNVASQKAFRNAGFQFETRTDDGVDLIYTYTL